LFFGSIVREKALKHGSLCKSY